MNNSVKRIYIKNHFIWKSKKTLNFKFKFDLVTKLFIYYKNYLDVFNRKGFNTLLF